MSPRTHRLALATGALLMIGACGAPPKVLPTSAPRAAGSLSASPIAPPLPSYAAPSAVATALPGYTVTYPTFQVPTTLATTTSPTPTPTPSHAATCTGQPTGTEILTMIKGKDGVPDETLQVQDGPFCSGEWSFTTVEIAGKSADELEPLMVVATGKGSTLTFVAAGTDVCNSRVQSAPAGIRVMACGF
ncbi:hypothetical protein [Actinoplanes sp. NPDC051851]|uniref:hypothetical protein n=1 Tax=Actinoplanes sp. NPDC051851 TaxID=3154753 RepID=UPI00344282F1